MDKIQIQAEKLKVPYPANLPVAEMRRLGFEVDNFIPKHALYVRKGTQPVQVTSRSEAADEEWMFVWCYGLPWEVTRELELETLRDLVHSVESR